MDALTPLLIAKALDGLTARAEATAVNIANANSPGYRPLKVDFEGRLRAAAGDGAAAIDAVRPDVTTLAPTRLAPDMRLDLELATAWQTSMRYAALIDLLGREMAISRAALAGGR
ncbi:flagellar basal body rod protein FlgB [uncultured Sphingomonas sp.]|uniref:flagellar basal body rod protein FlgB n=1 Tax=uncultured Sphingomonas sp. TaxID=158754 RepID=UPI00374A25AC